MSKTGAYIKDFAKTNPVTTVVIGGVLFFIIRAQIKKLLKPAPPEPKPLPIPVPEPTPTPSPGGSKTYSYDSEQYNNWADTLQEAFNGLGTDWSTVKRVFSYMKNRFDILALIDSYGKRAITSPYGWSTGAMNLNQTMSYELDDSEITEINQLIKNTGYKF